MSLNSSNHSGARLAELMAALSLATDLGMGQPMEFALSSCILAVRLAEKCGYSDEALREVYYQALLRYIGCNAETEARIIAVAANPAEAAVAYGKMTGACAICGRHLENEESVARGIGPVCAGKYGF